MNRMAKDNRGFTLLEMMMTVAVLGIFFGVVYGFLNHNLKFMRERGSEQDYQLQGRVVMIRLENILHRYEKFQVSGVEVQAIDSTPPVRLINFEKNTGNIPGVEYFFVWDDIRGVGEIRNSAFDTVARGIRTFNIEGGGSFIEVTVQTVPPGNPSDPGQTLFTRFRKDRGYDPL